MRLNDRGKIFVLVAGLLLLAGNAAIATDLDVDMPLPPPSSTTPRDPHVYASQPNCKRWTDECVNCARGDNGGAAVCSNIGMACQPKAIRCIEADPAPIPAPAVDSKPVAPAAGSNSNAPSRNTNTAAPPADPPSTPPPDSQDKPQPRQ